MGLKGGVVPLMRGRLPCVGRDRICAAWRMQGALAARLPLSPPDDAHMPLLREHQPLPPTSFTGGTCINPCASLGSRSAPSLDLGPLESSADLVEVQPLTPVEIAYFNVICVGHIPIHSMLHYGIGRRKVK